MSIKVEEKLRGRTRSTGRNASAEIQYIIHATAGEDDDEIELALLEAAPSRYANLALDGVGFLEPININRGIWEGAVRYTQQELVKAEPGTGKTSFRTTGGTQHVSYSRGTVAPYMRPGKLPIDFKNAIGVQPGGHVEGCDIFVPVFEWQETHTFAESAVSVAYITTIYELTGTVANDVWRVFAVGDVLFMGAEGDQRPDGNWDITFHFAAAKTMRYTSIGDIKAIGGGPIVKRGFDYLWVHYREEEVTLTGGSEKMLVSIPWQVNVEQVYPGGDFPLLGIGT